MHGGVNAARVRWLAGIAEGARGVPSGEVFFRIEATNRVAGDGGEFFLALGAFFEGRAKSIFFPGLQLRGDFYGTARFLRIGAPGIKV
jgi:hypothetical protein